MCPFLSSIEPLPVPSAGTSEQQFALGGLGGDVDDRAVGPFIDEDVRPLFGSEFFEADERIAGQVVDQGRIGPRGNGRLFENPAAWSRQGRDDAARGAWRAGRPAGPQPAGANPFAARRWRPVRRRGPREGRRRERFIRRSSVAAGDFNLQFAMINGQLQWTEVFGINSCNDCKLNMQIGSTWRTKPDYRASMKVAGHSDRDMVV